MGIRVTKVVGYGLTGLSIDPQNKMSTNDPRINMECPALTYDYADKDSDGSYMERLQAVADRMDDPEFYDSEEFSLIFALRSLEEELKGQNPAKSFSLMHNIVYEGEYGDPGTLVIVPPGMYSSWVRSGDHIDIIESYLDHEDNTDPIVRLLPSSPFPFSGRMDARTGKKISQSLDRKIQSIARLEHALKNSKVLNEELRGDITKGLSRIQEDVSNDVDVASYEEFQQTVVPMVPVEVRDFVQWSGIFQDPESWKDLRPMLYTYWA